HRRADRAELDDIANQPNCRALCRTTHGEHGQFVRTAWLTLLCRCTKTYVGYIANLHFPTQATEKVARNRHLRAKHRRVDSFWITCQRNGRYAAALRLLDRVD